MPTLKIGGKTYEVSMVERIDRDAFVEGETDFVEQTIRIHGGLKPDATREVILHEALHCIFHNAGDDASNEDERLIRTLASGLNQLLTDNDWLLALFR